MTDSATDGPADAPVAPPRGDSWLQATVSGALAALLLVAGVELWRVFFGNNFHTVLPGRVYRSSQQSPRDLERWARSHGIKTVINLRGFCPLAPWYPEQCRALHRLNVCLEDVGFSARRMPAACELRRLVEVLDHAEFPVLIHCQRGSDRTGFACALAQLLYGGQTIAQARWQLGLRYGHVRAGHTERMDLALDEYELWLKDRHEEHSPDALRRWVAHGYHPGWFSSQLAILDRPESLPVRRPFVLRVRARNTSCRAWHLCRGSNTGVHLWGLLRRDNGEPCWMARAGLFEAVVPAGESIDLSVYFDPIKEPGRYRLFLDMADEQHGWFYQMDGEPLEEEFEARDEKTASGCRGRDRGLAGLANPLAGGE